MFPWPNGCPMAQGSIFQGSYVCRVLCSPGPVYLMFCVPSTVFSSFYVPNVLFFQEAVCSRGSMFPGSYVINVYFPWPCVPQVLCAQGPMFLEFYVPKVIFFSNFLCCQGFTFPDLQSLIFTGLLFPLATFSQLSGFHVPYFSEGLVSHVFTSPSFLLCTYFFFYWSLFL